MDIYEKDLTSVEIWKPIMDEINLVLEQREIMKASIIKPEALVVKTKY